MADISITNTINVSISEAPAGLGNYSTNSIYLLTNETPLSVNPYIWATDAQTIINEYGTNSKTAKMATALFSPSMNLRSGGGQVLVVPYTATDATAGSVTTVAITAEKITALKAVANGSLTISIDGTDFTKNQINFNAISQIDDIVTILENCGFDCDIEATSDSKIKFTSRRFGSESSIALKETSGATIDLYGENYLDGAQATTTEGANVTGTTLAEALAVAQEIAYCGGIITSQYQDNAAIIAAATAIQGQDHIYYETTKSLQNISVLGQSIQTAGLTSTRLSAYSMGTKEDTRRFVATYATVAQSVDYTGTNTAMTMNLKELTGMAADTGLNQTYYTLAKQFGVDIYGSTEGLSCLYSFDNGNYTDEVTNELWLKKALIVAGFNYLRQTSTKIPQTEKGMTGLKNAYANVCRQSVRNGVTGTGLAWNNSIPFGDPETFAQNIEQEGYYVYSIPIAQQDQADREDRKSPMISIAIKLAGAIHSSNVVVYISR